jgi:hypothetical protein
MLMVGGVAPISAGAAWTEPQTITQGGAGFVFDPQGDAVFTWLRGHRTDVARVQTRTLSTDGTLSPIQTLWTAGRKASHPAVAMDSDGNTVFAWIRYGTHELVRTRALSATGTLSPIQTISAPGRDAQSFQMAVSPAGTAFFTWRRYDGEHHRVQARTRSADGTLSPIRTLSAPGRDAQGFGMAVNPAGTAFFTWHRYDGKHQRVQARTWSADGTLSPTQTLSGAGYHAEGPMVVANARGRSLYTWSTRYDNPDRVSRIQTRVRGASGSLSSIQNISSPPQPDYAINERNFGLRVGLDAAGGALFAWMHSYTNPSPGRFNQVVYARGRSATGTLGPVNGVSETYAGGQAYLSDFAVNSAGQGVVTGDEVGSYAATYVDVFAAAITTTGVVTGYANLTYDNGDYESQDPRAAVDGAGNAILSWFRQGYDEADRGLAVQVMDANGVLGPLRTLSSTATTPSRVEVTPAGNAVVTWLDRNTNGDYVTWASAGP